MTLTSIRKIYSKTTTFALMSKGICGQFKLELEGSKKSMLMMSMRTHRMRMTSSLKSTICSMDPG